MCKIIWPNLSDEIRKDVGYNYIKYRVGSGDIPNLALNFFKITNSVNFIPEFYRTTLFDDQSSVVLDLAMRGDSMSELEGALADMVSLGYDVPVSCIPMYVKSVFASLVGHEYSYSQKAHITALDIMSNMTTHHIDSLLDMFKSDQDVILMVSSVNQILRAKVGIRVLFGISLVQSHKKSLESFLEMDEDRIQGHMAKRLARNT